MGIYPRITFHAASGHLAHSLVRMMGENPATRITESAGEVAREQFGSEPNFFFGSLAGESEESWRGFKVLQFAQQSIRVFGKSVPKDIVLDAEGCALWQREGMVGKIENIRLFVLVGEPAAFASLVSPPNVEKIYVGGLQWDEADIARIRPKFLSSLKRPFGC